MRHAIFVTSLAACTVPPAFHTLETAETLAAGNASVTVAGGGGAGDGLHNCCWGAAARVRYGIGGDQELGVDGDVIGTTDSVTTGGAKAAYKRRIAKHFAVLAGAGVMIDGDSGAKTDGGADLGLVGSTRASTQTTVYGALRVAAAVPLHSDMYSLGGISETLVVPAGIAFALAAHVKLLAEVGGIAALYETRPVSNAVGDTSIHTFHAFGYYGALGITYAP